MSIFIAVLAIAGELDTESSQPRVLLGSLEADKREMVHAMTYTRDLRTNPP